MYSLLYTIAMWEMGRYTKTYHILLLKFSKIGGPEDRCNTDGCVRGGGGVEHLNEQGVGGAHVCPW